MFVNIENLTKIYGTQKAIDSLNFSVEKGEILGFLGENGAGKSTTMKIITCFIPPTEGTVTIGSANIHEHPLEIRRQVGYLPENNPLYLDMYVHEFLHFAGKIQGMEKKAIQKRTAEVIEMTGLGREQHKKIAMLSKGYRQRVGLSQALIHDPEVLILDEPTTGLDPNQILEIRNLIKEVGKQKTVIFSSHILPEVEAIADRIVIIKQGRLVADDTTSVVSTLHQDSIHFHVSFDKKGFNFSKLKENPALIDIVPKSETEFIIQTVMNSEIRKTLFQECVRQNFILMELRKEEYTLTDTFRKLTT